MTSFGAMAVEPLNRDQATRLIAARRGAAGETVPQAGSWPLAADDFEELFTRGSVTPRKLLSLCAEGFETALHPSDEGLPATAAPPRGPSVAAFLKDAWGTCFEQKRAANAPETTEEIVRHGLPLLVNLTAPQVRLVRDDLLADVSLIFEGPQGRAGLSLCTQSNMNSLAARLKRLKGQVALRRLDRLVLLRDSRIPISTGAKAARQHLEALEQQHVLSVIPTVEALAALDALRELLSDAKSGDLACRGMAVVPQTVEEWLTPHLPNSLRDFGEEILGKPVLVRPVSIL